MMPISVEYSTYNHQEPFGSSLMDDRFITVTHLHYSSTRTTIRYSLAASDSTLPSVLHEFIKSHYSDTEV